jgi:hypothetical protein
MKINRRHRKTPAERDWKIDESLTGTRNTVMLLREAQ